MKRYHDQSNKEFAGGLLTVSEGESLMTMVGSMAADMEMEQELRAYMLKHQPSGRERTLWDTSPPTRPPF